MPPLGVQRDLFNNFAAPNCLYHYQPEWMGETGMDDGCTFEKLRHPHEVAELKDLCAI